MSSIQTPCRTTGVVQYNGDVPTSPPGSPKNGIRDDLVTKADLDKMYFKHLMKMEQNEVNKHNVLISLPSFMEFMDSFHCIQCNKKTKTTMKKKTAGLATSFVWVCNECKTTTTLGSKCIQNREHSSHDFEELI